MKIFKKLSCMLIFCIMCLSSSVFADKALNIAFVGLLASGKTALISEITSIPFDYNERKATTKTSVCCKNLRYFDKDIRCYLYDTSGSDHLRNAIITRRLADADIVVLAIDTSEGEFKEIFKQNFVKWIDNINVVHQNLPILFALTKIDVSNDISEFCCRLGKFCEVYADTCDYELVATSAKERTNLGNLTDSEDLGNNFWGRIRYMIKQRKMHDLLREDVEEKVF